MPVTRRALALVAVSFALSFAGGCGEQAPDPVATRAQPEQPARLSAGERRRVAQLDRRIATHCIRVARSLVRPRAAPSERERERAFAAADELIELAAANPTADLGAGQDLRLLLSDTVENLEGSNCDPAMLSRLQQGLASVPVE